METELQGESRQEVREIMDEDNNNPENALVVYLARNIFVKTLFSEGFPGEIEQITDELVVSVPALVLFQEVGHEIPIAYQFHPGKAEVGIAGRVDLMKLSRQNEVEGHYLVSIEVVLFPSGIADKVQEQLEE